jgi:uncharacterized protein
MRSVIAKRYIWLCLPLLVSLGGDKSAFADAEFGGAKTPTTKRYLNVDALGNDKVWLKDVGSVEQCESLCLSDPLCAGYTYNITRKVCIPKASIGALSPSRDPAVTGVISRTAPPQHNNEAGAEVVRHPNMDAPGGDRNWIHAVGSLDACEGLCLADSGCAGYTYNFNRKVCITKAAIGPLSSSRDTATTGIVKHSNGDQAPSSVTTRAMTPSFDCHRARNDAERSICGSQSLIALDVALTILYRTALARGAVDEEGKQRAWIAVRDHCETDLDCLDRSYQARFWELQFYERQAATQAQLSYPPKLETSVNQQEAASSGPVASVQTLSNPIRLTGKADQPCDLAEEGLVRLRKTLSVTIPDGMAMQAGNLRSLFWKTGGAPPASPTYLVLAMNGPLRLQSGDAGGGNSGLYALTPDAAAPFRLKQFLDQTRIIVPLHVPGAPNSGEIKIRPLVAGPLQLSAAIIGVTRCGEKPDPAPMVLNLLIEPGNAEIVVADRFELKAPEETIVSPDRKRTIEIFGSRFHLIDSATGALLADEPGEQPRFSPTGRFILLRETNRYAAFDAIDGKLIQEGTDLYKHSYDVDAIWDNGDSFAITMSYEETREKKELAGGIFQIRNLLNEVSLLPQWSGCLGDTKLLRDVAFKIDLENNVEMNACNKAGQLVGRHQLLAQSLTIGGSDEKSLLEAAVVPVVAPERWEMIRGLQITQTADYDAAFQTKLAPFIVPCLSIKKTHTTVAIEQPFRSASRSLAELPEALRNLRDEARLNEFGIKIDLGVHLAKVEQGELFKENPENPLALQFINYPKLQIVREYQSSQPVIYFDSSRCGEVKRRPDGTISVAVAGASTGNVSPRKITGNGFTATIISGACRVANGVNPNGYALLYDSRHEGALFDLSAGLHASANNGCGVARGGFFACDFDGALFLNRYLVVWSQAALRVAIYDIDQPALVWQSESLPSLDVMRYLSLSNDLKSLVKLDRDGNFQVIGLMLGPNSPPDNFIGEISHPILLTGRVVDDEVVIWTPSGLFDSTPEGASHVAVRFAGVNGIFTLEQFRSLLHVDNLLGRTLQGERFDRPHVTKIPPQIDVTPSFSADTIAAKINILGNEAVDEIRLYQDGLITDRIKVEGSNSSVDVSAKRLPGARWVSFLARGPSGLYSRPASFDGGPSAAVRRLRLVSIGIDHYHDPGIRQLQFADSDAARFVEAVKKIARGTVQIVSETLLLDDAASRDSIVARIGETIADADPGDSIVLFIAGHGVKAGDDYYLGTSATRLNDIQHTSLGWRDLSAILAKARSRIAVFLDTCHSGNAGTDFFATNDASANALLDKAPTGILIFSASKARELSHETAKQGGGVFTTAIVTALSDPETDLNRNGVIEASELYAAVKRAVVEKTGGQQTPWFARNDMVGDFPPF